MKYKNLYTNGCSFTAGDLVPDGKIWPDLLAKELGLDLICAAGNGQSFESIVHNTINHVSDLDSKDTLVVIGLTWTPRYLVSFDKFNFNITPADIEGDKKEFYDKTSTWRRITSPYVYDYKKIETDNINLHNIHKDFEKESVFETLSAFCTYYKTLTKNDKFLLKNQQLRYTTLLVLLQSFLKSNNFNYRIVKFQGDYGIWGTVKDLPIVKKIDKKYIIDFIPEEENCELIKAHPSEKCCIQIKDKIIKSLND